MSQSDPKGSQTNGASHPRMTGAEREALEVANDPILAQMLEEERIESSAFDTALLWRLIKRVKPYKSLAALAIVLATIEAVVMTAPAWLIGLAVDSVTGAERFSAWSQWLLDQAAIYEGVLPRSGNSGSPGRAWARQSSIEANHDRRELSDSADKREDHCRRQRNWLVRNSSSNR